MKRFVMVVQDKGGTGKSIISRFIADRYARDGVKALLVDGDGEVGQLFQFYCKVDADGNAVVQSAGDGVLTLRFTGIEKERDRLISFLDMGMDTVLVDMPAGSIKALTEFDRETGFFDELEKCGYRATLINVLSPFQSATRTVAEMVGIASNKADYVAVVNRWFGDDEDFYMWFGDANNAPSKGREILRSHSGIEIEFPKVQTGVLVAIDDFMLPFHRAVSDERLSRVQRSRLYRWMKTSDIELDKIAQFINVLPAK